MSGLPEGWGVLTLADLAGPQGLVSDGDWIESKDQDVSGTIRLTQLADIGDGKFLNRSSRYVNTQTATRLRCTYLEQGDLLIARMPDPLGRACIFPGVGQPAITAVDVFVWRTDGSRSDARWVMYAINSPDIRDRIQSEAGGTTRQRVAGGKLKRLTLPTPSLPEQRRIVAKLDSLTTRTARARDEFERIPRLIQKYREAILAAAYSGELTREWRQQKRIKSAWSARQAGQIINSIVAGKNLRCEERPPLQGENGVVKVSAVTWGTFDPAAAKTLPSNFSPPDRTKIRAGDFLISRANTLELVGAVVIVDQAPDNLFLSDKILRLEMESSHKPWMLWFLRSPEGRKAIETKATGNQLSMRNLSQDALSKIDVPWPVENERQEIIRRIETAFAWLDRVAAEHANASRLLPKLDQAILAKAFRGELVPQDSNEKPVEHSAEPTADGRAHRGRSTCEPVAALPQVDDNSRRRRKQRRGQF